MITMQNIILNDYVIIFSMIEHVNVYFQNGY